HARENRRHAINASIRGAALVVLHLLQPSQDLDQPLQLTFDHVQRVARVTGRNARILEQQLHVAQGGRDRVVCIMADPADQLDNLAILLLIHSASSPRVGTPLYTPRELLANHALPQQQPLATAGLKGQPCVVTFHATHCGGSGPRLVPPGRIGSRTAGGAASAARARWCPRPCVHSTKEVIPWPVPVSAT